MSDPRDYKLDLSGSSDDATPSKPRPLRAFISVMFACHNRYQRAYKNDAGDAYEGACPQCGKRVRFPIGPGGTSARAFVVE